MSTIQLDPGDQGIQWIEGVGFRPVDMTEELCGFTDTCEQCEKVQCSNENWSITEKWEPSIYAKLYVPVYQLNPPIDGHTPTWTECCINDTLPDPWIPFMETSVVLFSPSLLFLITTLASILIIRRLT